MNYAGKFGSGELDPFSGGDIGLGPLLSPHGHLSSPGKFHVDKVSTHAPSDAIIISDAHLLFHGDFKRSGVDLILSSGDRELVLREYFKGEKRAALASPDGAHLTGDIVNALAGHTQFAQADGSASVAPAVIGHVTKLAGNATAIRNGVSIILNQGDNVNKGDVVQSGSDSTLGITFIDGTVFGLASNAKMVLNEMIYDPNGSDNKSLLSLVAGHDLVRRRRHRQERRHEGRHPGRDHGHPRHRGAGRDRFRGAGRRAVRRRRNSRCWSSPTAPPAPTSCSTRPR